MEIIEGICRFCDEPFRYERKSHRGAIRVSCEKCRKENWKRYRARNVDKERERKQRWRDKKRQELGIPSRPTGKRVKRRALPLGVRFAVLRRDDFTCRYCGGKAPNVELHVDHVVPIADGGTDHPSNLAAACSDCNYGKLDLPAAA